MKSNDNEDKQTDAMKRLDLAEQRNKDMEAKMNRMQPNTMDRANDKESSSTATILIILIVLLLGVFGTYMYFNNKNNNK